MPDARLPDEPQGRQRLPVPSIGEPWLIAPRLAAGRVSATTIVPLNGATGLVLIFGQLTRPAQRRWQYRSLGPPVRGPGERDIRRVVLAALPGALADFIGTVADQQLAAELRAEMRLIETARGG